MIDLYSLTVLGNTPSYTIRVSMTVPHRPEMGSDAASLGPAISLLLDSLVAAGETDPAIRSALHVIAEYVRRGSSEIGRSDEKSATVTRLNAETYVLPSDYFGPGSDAAPSSFVTSVANRPLSGAASRLEESDHWPAVQSSRPQLTLGKGPSEPVAKRVEYPSGYMPAESVGSRVDLSLVQLRLSMKADGARWAGQRRKLLTGAVDFALEIEPRDREIIRRAKEIPGCYLWTNGPNSPMPFDLESFEVLARCYENAAASVANVVALEEECASDTDPRNQIAFQLLAEAQSSLRVAATQVGGPEDSDQFELFHWLKLNTRDREIYVARHMRVADPADPSEWHSLAKRIERFKEEVDSKRSQDKLRQKLVGKVRHKASTILQGSATQETWQILDKAVDDLIECGFTPSNREVREVLLPLVNLIPDDLQISPGLQRALDEIDIFSTTNSSPSVDSSPEIERVSHEVERVRSLLAGGSIVLIGGERRLDREEALRRALRLRELYWMKTSEQHQPLDAFEPVIAKDDVACVVLMIRWSRHGYGDVKRFCERYDKPLVRLPGGYGVNQIAKQIADQIGHLLHAKRVQNK